MAIQKRYNGDSSGVVNVDKNLHAAMNGVDPVSSKIISTGIGKHITAIRIYNGAALDTDAQMGVGGAVEAILRTFQIKGTTIAYQIDGASLSLIAEATGWGVTNPQTGAITVTADDDLKAALIALTNRPADANIPVTAYDFTALLVDSSKGIKISAA